MKTFLALTTGFLSGFVATCALVVLSEEYGYYVGNRNGEEKESDDISTEEEA